MQTCIHLSAVAVQMIFRRGVHADIPSVCGHFTIFCAWVYGEMEVIDECRVVQRKSRALAELGRCVCVLGLHGDASGL